MSEFKLEIGLEELRKIVEDLERGDVELEQSIEKYQRGMSLVKECKDKLENAKEVLLKNSNDEDNF